MERELSLEKEANVVKLINYHKAKGLQSKIIVLMPKGNPNIKGTDYRKEKNYYPNIRLLGTSNYFLGEDYIQQEANYQDQCEKKRLDYVAKTRAEEALLIFPNFEDNSPQERPLLQAGESHLLEIDMSLFQSDVNRNLEAYERFQRR